jgi:serine/threonine protein kinase
MARDLAEVVDFGRYEPLFRIGLGGMAEVYAARIRGEAGFQKLVAVKRMLPHLTGDKKFVDMFLDEARLAANISSPHVVQTLDLGRADDESLYIVMDLILGVTISQMLRHFAEKRQYVDPGVAIELISQAAQGLDDAHEAIAPNGQPLSLVHRDISPQNILVGTDGRARVTDFGIAHAIMLRRTETQVGEMKGKFAYFSPEQAIGRPLDRRSDIFALGIVAWELITGRRLFRGTPLEQLEAVKRCEIPTPISMRPDLPAGLSDTIMKAVARDPEDRFASAAAFSAALRRAAGNADIPGPRVIGHFVKEIGGDRLERMRQCIANSGRLPADVPKVTAIIEGTVSGTHFIAESVEDTHILDDEVSEIIAAGASPMGRDQKETSERGMPPTEEVLLTFGSMAIDEMPLDDSTELAAPPSAFAPTQVKGIAEASTFVGPADGSMTLSAPPDIADIHQAPTQQWMESAQPITETRAPRALMVGLGAGLGALLLIGIITWSVSGEDTAESSGIAEPPTTAAPIATTVESPSVSMQSASGANGANDEGVSGESHAESDVDRDPAEEEADTEDGDDHETGVRRNMRRALRMTMRGGGSTTVSTSSSMSSATDTQDNPAMSTGIPTWMR